ncbi:hypothetical protein D3C81_1700230 [compost metagenome]
MDISSLFQGPCQRTVYAQVFQRGQRMIDQVAKAACRRHYEQGIFLVVQLLLHTEQTVRRHAEQARYLYHHAGGEFFQGLQCHQLGAGAQDHIQAAAA